MAKSFDLGDLLSIRSISSHHKQFTDQHLKLVILDVIGSTSQKRLRSIFQRLILKDQGLTKFESRLLKFILQDLRVATSDFDRVVDDFGQWPNENVIYNDFSVLVDDQISHLRGTVLHTNAGFFHYVYQSGLNGAKAPNDYPWLSDDYPEPLIAYLLDQGYIYIMNYYYFGSDNHRRL